MSHDRAISLQWIRQQTVMASLIGLQFGVLEALWLHRGGFLLGVNSLTVIALGHFLVGLTLGVLVSAVRLFARTLLPLSLNGWGGMAPSLLVFLALAAITMNVRNPLRILHPVSLAQDIGLLALVVLAGWGWSRRPWRSVVDARLLGLLLLADLVIVIVVLLPGRSQSVPVAQNGFEPAPDGTPDIVVLLVDALRADHLGIYGYDRKTSARIDDLASHGAVFERAYSVSNWTRPTVASLHSSTMPSRHGTIAIDRGLPRSLPLLAEQFQAVGYATAFFSVGVNIAPEDGYGRGLDHFYSAKSRAAVERTPVFQRGVLKALPSLRSWLQVREDSSAPDELNRHILDWFQELDARRPAFAYVHYMGPHRPYWPPPPYDTAFTDAGVQERLTKPPRQLAGPTALSAEDRHQMIAQYDGEILMHDVAIGDLLDQLEHLGRLENAIVVITADHGEGFGEHGVWGHGRGLFEEIARVPLIVWSTQEWSTPQRLSVPASLIDLAPTLVDLAGGDIPEQWDGRSLRPWLTGERQDDDRVVFQENGPTGEYGLRNGDWAYFEGEIDGELRQWLYADDDQLQERELSERYPLYVDEFHQLVGERSKMDESFGTEAPHVEIDDERARRLKALGYID